MFSPDSYSSPLLFRWLLQTEQKQAGIQDSSLGKSDVKEGFLGGSFHSLPLSPKRQLLATCISERNLNFWEGLKYFKRQWDHFVTCGVVHGIDSH